MNVHDRQRETAALVSRGEAVLGIELGSTRIKACLIDGDHRPIASGSHAWENELVDGTWTYALEDVWAGLQAAYADLVECVERRYGVRPTSFRALGISAMMHGYLAFDSDNNLLTPFRTWRNTSTGRAAAELTQLLGQNIPLRWSVAHLYQAVLDGETHVPAVRSLTTLAGYVHRALTGHDVLGVGDASGMFPIDPATRDYDATCLERADALLRSHGLAAPLRDLLPTVLLAGDHAGRLTADGALLLDPSGAMQPGVPLCPPEGDAGTGMVATNAVASRTGNISVGTSVFAMVVLEKPLRHVHPEVDVVTTPSGDLVAMVHCNNGASELAAWAGLLGEFASALGHDDGADEVFGVLLRSALDASPDAGGILAYNHLSGEPIAGLTSGRPLVVRTPGGQLTLPNFARSLVYGVFGTLTMGLRVLADEGVTWDALHAHGGLFRTAGVAQRLLAAAVDAPVAVATSADEGGAWGMAVLAAFVSADGTGLDRYLADRVFASVPVSVETPDPADVAGYAAYLERYTAALAVERKAVETLPTER